jgi:uroporphyrinogen decarboxylase
VEKGALVSPLRAKAGRKPLLRALGGETLAVPPVWLMRQAGRYLPEYRALRGQARNFLTFCLTPELAAEATLQPIRRFGFDAAILFADILVVPHGLGQTVAFREGEGPALEPVTDAAGIERLTPSTVALRTAPVMETVRRVRTELPASVALIGFAGSPWTVATYMVEGGTSRDFTRTKRWAFADPEPFAVLIGKIVEGTIVYLSAQIDAGAEVIQLFDSWAGVLPDPAFERWVIAPTRAIVRALKQSHPEVPIIGFPRGAGLRYQSYARETGVDAVSLDSTVPLAWTRQHLQAMLPVQGNLDPVLLLTGGNAMLSAAREIRDALALGPFVFNLGHGILPETPPEHVSALLSVIRAPVS